MKSVKVYVLVLPRSQRFWPLNPGSFDILKLQSVVCSFSKVSEMFFWVLDIIAANAHVTWQTCWDHLLCRVTVPSLVLFITRIFLISSPGSLGSSFVFELINIHTWRHIHVTYLSFIFVNGNIGCFKFCITAKIF